MSFPDAIPEDSWADMQVKGRVSGERLNLENIATRY